MRTLIIGGGQLGHSLARSLGPDTMTATGIPWAQPDEARRHVHNTVNDFLTANESGRWLICWSAGAGVVGTPDTALRHERRSLELFLDAVSKHPGFIPELGGVFVASSAGGIYADGSGEEHTEYSPTTPQSAYGRNKLLQDELVQQWASQHRVRTLIGRISNLYGPRQDLGKPQGFISHLCRAMARRTTFTLRVPISTMRDFIYTDDVAERIALWANAEVPQHDWGQIKLLASGRSVTLGHVIGMTRAISRTPARVLLASSNTPGEQPLALRFRSRVLRELDDACPARPLEEGIAQTWRGALRGVQGA